MLSDRCLSVCLSVCPVLSVTLVYCGQTVGRIKMKHGMQVGLGPGHSGHIVLDEAQLLLPYRGRSPSPIFGPYLLQPNGWMDQYATRYGGRTQPRRLCVKWGPSSLPKKGAEPPPKFSADVHCVQTAGWIKIALGTKVGLGLGYIVLDWDPASLPKKGAQPPPQFSAHFYCGQTAGCIKMPLGIEVGRSPGEFVLDGDPAPSENRGRSPSPILRVEVENFEIGPEVRRTSVIANFVALEQQIILVKTRSESV